MTIQDLKKANEETKAAWNENAAFWDKWMGEGNDFVEVLIWPATERLLQPRPGQRILDIACGNGLSSRRLAALGVEVVAFDFAAEMIAYVRERTVAYAERITYLVLDATDEAALLGLSWG
jgi:2-polyprenyl-3-methyl-5-hydroxy-6-metoxy-1,4-benzoquinol methylase